MPYSGGGDANLPKAVKKLPKALRELWVRVFNENYDPDDEGHAHKIAWGAVRRVESAHAAKEWLHVDRATLLAWLNGQPQGEHLMPETDQKSFALQERERAVSNAFGQAFGGLAVRVYDTYLIGLVPPEREDEDEAEDAVEGEADEPMAAPLADVYWKVPYNVGTAQAGEEEVTASGDLRATGDVDAGRADLLRTQALRRAGGPHALAARLVRRLRGSRPRDRLNGVPRIGGGLRRTQQGARPLADLAHPRLGSGDVRLPSHRWRAGHVVGVRLVRCDPQGRARGGLLPPEKRRDRGVDSFSVGQPHRGRRVPAARYDSGTLALAARKRRVPLVRPATH